MLRPLSPHPSRPRSLALALALLLVAMLPGCGPGSGAAPAGATPSPPPSPEPGPVALADPPISEPGRVSALPRQSPLPDPAALILLRDRERLVPLPRGLRLLSVVVAPAGTDDGGELDGALRAAGWTLESRRMDPAATPAEYDALARAVDVAGLVVVSLHGDVLPGATADFLTRTELRRPLVLIALGGTEPLAAAPTAGTYLLAPDADPATQRSVGRALVGLEPIAAGPRGEGLVREVRPLPDMEPLPRTPATLPTATNFVEMDPAAAGMDPVALERVDSIILAALADSVAPGVALAVGRRGRIVLLRGYGTIDWADDRPVTPATLFDLASLTKVVATTTAAMLLEADGRLELDAAAIRYLPWWAGEDARKREVTVRQLLLHRAGLAAFRPWFRDRSGRAEYREALAEERLERAPGTRALYSDIGFLTLGLVLEAASGMPLDSLLATRVWAPLGMEDTWFRPDPELLPRIAPTELDTIWRRAHVRGRVHDENADAFGGVAGHAGLFSTAWDLAIFADLMLAGGIAPACMPAVRSGVACTRARQEPLRLLSEESVRRWTARAEPATAYALGWDTPEGPGSSAGSFLTAGAFGHTGFTGTSIWIDPTLDLYVVLLTNRINPSRTNQRHVPLRRAVHDAVARAVRDRPVAPRR